MNGRTCAARFFPAIPAGDDSGFPRPVVDPPGEYLNPSKWQGPKGLGGERTCGKWLDFWSGLVKQVCDAGLVLGAHAELPERRVNWAMGFVRRKGKDLMMARWANPDNGGPDVLERVQRSLTVDMIMTPRADLRTCRRDEIASAVMARNTEHFSFLPVVDEPGRFLGLYRAERWFGKEAPQEKIGDDFEPFSEDVVIGADASIIDFVKNADERATRLVVSGDRVAGLVSLSDLQQLPVRAALFTLITRLEMAMAERIETEWVGDESMGWLELLSEKRRACIVDAIGKAKQEDGFVSEIAFSQLADKVTIIRKKGLIPGSGSRLRREFKAIRKLRDGIAHANYYAESPGAACKACETVRTILRIKEELAAAIKDHVASV